MGIGEKIAAARKALKWTQEDLAWKMEVPAWNNAAWLMRYQMVTMLEAFKRLL